MKTFTTFGILAAFMLATTIANAEENAPRPEIRALVLQLAANSTQPPIDDKKAELIRVHEAQAKKDPAAAMKKAMTTFNETGDADFVLVTATTWIEKNENDFVIWYHTLPATDYGRIKERITAALPESWKDDPAYVPTHLPLSARQNMAVVRARSLITGGQAETVLKETETLANMAIKKAVLAVLAESPQTREGIEAKRLLGSLK